MEEKITDKNEYPDELDNWFNEQNEETMEIINTNLIPEEEPLSENVISMNCTFIDENKSEDKMDDDVMDNNTRYIYIEDILIKNIESLSSYELIQDECSIAYFIQVLIEGSTNSKIKSSKVHDEDLTTEKIKSIIEYLKWISKTSEILAKRIGQDILFYQEETIPSIIRSSYNFCNKYTQCKNFYSKNVPPSCKEHHYVHSILKYDIDSVINFLNFTIENNINMTEENLKNLYLSIKTICFVTRHMAKEISHIHYITINNSEAFHRNNPIEMNKRKVIIKKQYNTDSLKRNVKNDNFKKISKEFMFDMDFNRSQRFEPNINISRNEGFGPKNNGSFRKNSNFVPIIKQKMETSNNRYSVLSKN